MTTRNEVIARIQALMDSEPQPSEAFLRDWPAELYPEAVDECLKDLRCYVPLRNIGRSYRASARNALEQARYLGLTRIGRLPRTVDRRHAVHTVERTGQLDLLEAMP